MIELVIENTSFALADGTSLSITATNSALSNDNVGRVYSYPFKLPWSPQLLAFFKHLRRLDADRSARNMSTYIKIANFVLTKGVIKTNDKNAKSTKQSLSLYFKKDNNAILKKLEDFKIAEVCPKIVIPQTKFRGYIIKLKNNVTPGTFYYLNIGGTVINYTSQSNQQMEVITYFKNEINNHFGDIATIQNNSQTQFVELIINVSAAISLMMDKPGVIDFGGFEYITHASFAEATHENFISFFHDNLINARDDISFNWVVNEDFYQGKNPQYFFPWFNYAFHYDNDPDWTIPTNAPSNSEQFERSFIPFFRLRYVLQKMLERIGVNNFTFEGNQDYWNDMMTILIDNNTALDNVRKDYFFTNTDAQSVEFFLNCHVSEINASDHLPDMTAKDLLDTFANFFNLDYEITDTNELLFKMKNRIFSQKAIMWDIFLEDDERGYNIDGGFLIKYIKNELELLSDNTLQPFQVGAGEFIIELPASTLHIYESFNIVKSRRAGSTTAFNLGKKNFPLRFFFDKGIIDNQYLASDNTTDNLSLSITGDKGLFNVFFKGSAELQASGFPLSIERMITPQELAQMMTFDTSKVYMMTNKGNVIAFIKEVQTKIDVNTPKLIRVKFEIIVK